MAKSLLDRLLVWAEVTEYTVRSLLNREKDAPPSRAELARGYQDEMMGIRHREQLRRETRRDPISERDQDEPPNLTLVVAVSPANVLQADQKGEFPLIEQARGITGGGEYVDPAVWFEVAHASLNLERRFGPDITRDILRPSVNYLMALQLGELVAQNVGIIRHVPAEAGPADIGQLLDLPPKITRTSNRTTERTTANYGVVVYAQVLTKAEQAYMRAAAHVELAKEKDRFGELPERFRPDLPDFVPSGELGKKELQSITPEALQHSRVEAIFTSVEGRGKKVSRIVFADSQGNVLADSKQQPELLNLAAARTRVVADGMERTLSRAAYAELSAGWADLSRKAQDLTSGQGRTMGDTVEQKLYLEWTRLDQESGAVPPVVLPPQDHYSQYLTQKLFKQNYLDNRPLGGVPADRRTFVAIVGPTGVNLDLAAAATIRGFAQPGDEKHPPINRLGTADSPRGVELNLTQFAERDYMHGLLRFKYGPQATASVLQDTASRFMSAVAGQVLAHTNVVAVFPTPISGQEFAMPHTVSRDEFRKANRPKEKAAEGAQMQPPELHKQLLVVMPGLAVQAVSRLEGYVEELRDVQAQNSNNMRRRNPQPLLEDALNLDVQPGAAENAELVRLIGVMVAAKSNGAEVIPVNESGEPLLDQQQTQQLQAQLQGLAAEQAHRAEREFSYVSWDLSWSSGYKDVADMFTSLQRRPLSGAELSGLADRMLDVIQGLQDNQALQPVMTAATALEKEVNTARIAALTVTPEEAEHKAVVAREAFYLEVAKPLLWAERGSREPDLSDIMTPAAGSEPGPGFDPAAVAPSLAAPSAITPIPSIHFIAGPPGAILGPAVTTAATNLIELSSQRLPITFGRDDLRLYFQDDHPAAPPAEIKATVDHCFQRTLADIREERRPAVIDLTGVPPQEIPALVRPFTERGAAVTVAVHIPNPNQMLQADYINNLPQALQRLAQTEAQQEPVSPAFQETIAALAAEPAVQLTFIDGIGAPKVLGVPATSPTLQADLAAPTVADPSVQTPTSTPIGQPLNTTANPALLATLTDATACRALLQALQQTPSTPQEQASELDTWRGLALDLGNRTDTPVAINQSIYQHTRRSAEQVGRNPAAQDAYIKQHYGTTAAAEQDSQRMIAYLLHSPNATNAEIPFCKNSALTAEAITIQKLLVVGPQHAAVEMGKGTYGLVALRELRDKGIALPEVGQPFTGPAKAKDGPEKGPKL